MQSPFGGGIIHLSTVANNGGNGGDRDDPSPAGAYHRQGERLGDDEEAVDRHVNDTPPLFFAHARKRAVINNAGIVDQDLDRAFFQQGLQACPHCLPVGDIETQGFG